MILDSEFWAFRLHATPTLIAGQGFIILKRHCETVSELSSDELAELGPFMSRVDSSLRSALKPVRVHFGLYGESVPHVHLHVLPRTQTLPAGNIPVTLLTLWYRTLERLRLRRRVPQSAVRQVTSVLRKAERS